VYMFDATVKLHQRATLVSWGGGNTSQSLLTYLFSIAPLHMSTEPYTFFASSCAAHHQRLPCPQEAHV